jgi:hypothetical protein
MTWDALNNVCQREKAPFIDHDRFAIRWDTDPEIQKIVASFDETEIVLKTTANSQEPTAKPTTDNSKISSIAKKVARKAF